MRGEQAETIVLRVLIPPSAGDDMPTIHIRIGRGHAVDVQNETIKSDG